MDEEVGSRAESRRSNASDVREGSHGDDGRPPVGATSSRVSQASGGSRASSAGADGDGEVSSRAGSAQSAEGDRPSRPETPGSRPGSSRRTYTPVGSEGSDGGSERSRPGTPENNESRSRPSTRGKSSTRNSILSVRSQNSRPATPDSAHEGADRPESGESGARSSRVGSSSTASDTNHQSRAQTPEKLESRPATSATEKARENSRSPTPESTKNPLDKSESGLDSKASGNMSRSETQGSDKTNSQISEKTVSRPGSNNLLQSRSATNDNNFLYSPILSRPGTPIRSVPLDSDEAKIHSQSTTLLIDEMIQSTISKAESNVSKLEDALSAGERSPSTGSATGSKMVETEDALSPVDESRASQNESRASQAEESCASPAEELRASPRSERRMDTPLPPKDLSDEDNDDDYEDEDFEDDDENIEDLKESKSFHSISESAGNSGEPDIEVIHGDDGPRVKFDDDLLVTDNFQEGNMLMAELATSTASQKRPLSPLPPRNGLKSAPDVAGVKPVPPKGPKGKKASNIPLRQTKSFSPKGVGGRALTSPRGRPANRAAGRGVEKGDLGTVRPPPRRPMPTLNNRPKIKLSPREPPNKPLGPVWRPAGRAPIKSNMWVTPNEPLPPVARRQGLSPDGPGPNNKQILITGKPKIPSQLESEAWWQNGRFNITIRGPETVLPPLPSCLVSVNPGSEANQDKDDIITEPIDVQITFRPEESTVVHKPFRQPYFRGGAPLRKEVKPSNRNVLNARAQYPAFNTRIDTPKGKRGRLRTDRKPIKAYINSTTNPLN